jgi:hypothetical protein
LHFDAETGQQKLNVVEGSGDFASISSRTNLD